MPQNPMVSPPGKPVNSADAATYIATIASELAALARQNGLDTRAYLLDMARLEAQNAAPPARQAKRS